MPFGINELYAITSVCQAQPSRLRKHSLHIPPLNYYNPLPHSAHRPRPILQMAAKSKSKQQEALQFLDDLDNLDAAPPPASTGSASAKTTPAKPSDAGDVLKFIDAVESDTSVYIMTERVQPLGKALQALSSKGEKEREEWLMWGLQRLSVRNYVLNFHGSDLLISIL